MVLQTDSVKFVQGSTIESDVPCRRCGYNLRGLTSCGACPECGDPVAESLRCYLKDSNPAYVRTIGRGALTMIVGTVLSAVAGALSSLTLPSLYLDLASNRASVILAIAPPVVMLVGLWKVSSIDPRGIEERQYEWLRKVVRATAMITTVAQLLRIATFFAFSLPSMAARVIGWILIPIDTIALIVGIFATLAYLQTLACRIPDYFLCRRFGSLRWCFGIPFSLFVLVVACGELFLVTTMSADIDDQLMAILTANTIGLAITVFAGLFYIDALLRLRRGVVSSLRPQKAPDTVG